MRHLGVECAAPQGRQLLLAQHTHLRQLIDAARVKARSVLESRTGVGELQTAVAMMQRQLLEHLVDEERYLDSVLASDASGHVRMSLLRAEHAHQRAILSILTGPAAWPAPNVVAGRVLSFCQEILDDMHFEERELFSRHPAD
jgi:hypothetical protein